MTTKTLKKQPVKAIRLYGNLVELLHENKPIITKLPQLIGMPVKSVHLSIRPHLLKLTIRIPVVDICFQIDTTRFPSCCGIVILHSLHVANKLQIPEKNIDNLLRIFMNLVLEYAEERYSLAMITDTDHNTPDDPYCTGYTAKLCRFESISSFHNINSGNTVKIYIKNL